MASASSSQSEKKQKSIRRSIASFSELFGQAHLYLAYHAALPLVLTPDLVYCLWVNFQRNVQGGVLNIPWIAVADLLLSHLCEEAGYELYEMDLAVRDALLKDLVADPQFGQQRLNELADFLLAYVRPQLNSPDPDVRDMALAQHWTALAYTQPTRTANEIATYLAKLDEDDRAELARIAALIETFMEPLADFTPLLIYARSMRYLARGDVAGAASQLREQLSKVAKADSLRVPSVHLPVPEQVRREVEEISEQGRDLRSISEQVQFPETSQQVVSQSVDDSSTKAIKVLSFYDYHDEELFYEFDKHMRVLQRQGIIDSYTSVKLPSLGHSYNDELGEFIEYINTAKIILLMISPDFMALDFCYGSDMKHVVERHELGEVLVIPIVFRPVYWQGALFGHLQALPTEGRHVRSADWNIDEAFFNVTEGIRKAIESLNGRLQPETPLIANSVESGRRREIDQVLPGVYESTRELTNQQRSMQYTLLELKGRYESIRKDIEQIKEIQSRILHSLEELLDDRD